MPGTTILTELSRNSVFVNNDNTNPGTNSVNASWPGATSWVQWTDFNAADLYRLYKDEVKIPWSDPTRVVEVTSMDKEIYNEDSLEHGVITKLILPSVNAALAKIYSDKHSAYKFEYSRGGRVYLDDRSRPDWALCSRSWKDDSNYYICFLPGDTKLYKKWQSSYFPQYLEYWQQPVRQILHYCHKTGSRYGFIINEWEVVVFRCRVEGTLPSGMASRPVRGVPLPAGHYHELSQSGSSNPDIAESFQDMSLNDTSTQVSSYRSTDSGAEFCPIEYQAIPWSNNGDGKRVLTVRLSLFYLAMIAGNGPREILPCYPSFDSWFFDQIARVYRHNTTGKVSKKMPDRGSLEWPDPSESGPDTIEQEGDHYLTRQSVETMNIDKSTGQYYYMVGNTRTFIDPQTWLFDTERQEYGTFQGLRWVTGSEMASAESSSRTKHKRRK